VCESAFACHILWRFFALARQLGPLVVSVLVYSMSLIWLVAPIRTGFEE
jgi:hypothetical protein